MGAFTKEQEKPKNAWRGGSLMASGAGRRSTVCGISGRRVTARRHGMISRLLDDINCIAFMSQPVVSAIKFTQHFK